MFPDVNQKLKYLSPTSFHMFYEKSHNNKNIVSGRLLYVCGLNDSYKEYITKKGGYNLYDAM